MNLLEEILSRRNRFPIISGGSPFRIIERLGASVVEAIVTEPDPIKYRYNYYYNSGINKLFMKINTKDGKQWKSVSI